MMRNIPQSRHTIISDCYNHIISFHLYIFEIRMNYYTVIYSYPNISKRNIPFEAKLHNFLLLFEKNVIIIFILRDNQIISQTSNSLFSCSVSFHNTQNIWLEGMLCKSTRGIHCCFCSL